MGDNVCEWFFSPTNVRNVYLAQKSKMVAKNMWKVAALKGALFTLGKSVSFEQDSEGPN